MKSSKKFNLSFSQFQICNTIPLQKQREPSTHMTIKSASIFEKINIIALTLEANIS